MSGKNRWTISLALFLGVLVVVIYTWVSRSGTQQQSVVSNTIHPHLASSSSTRARPRTTLSDQELTDTATYHNVRFDFAVAYPAKLLAAGQEADNGDGLQFTPKVGDADIRAYGSYNSLSQSPTDILQFNLQEDCAKNKVTYQVSKPTLVAYSCLSPKGRVVYEKVVMRDDTLATVRFDYDPREQTKWAPVIKQMADSLHLGSGRPMRTNRATVSPSTNGPAAS